MSVVRILRYYLDSEPMVVLACGLAGIGAGFAYLGPRVRDTLGMDTSQYFGSEASTSILERMKTRKLTWNKTETGVKPDVVQEE